VGNESSASQRCSTASSNKRYCRCFSLSLTRHFISQLWISSWKECAPSGESCALLCAGGAPHCGGRGSVEIFFDRVNHDVLMGRVSKRLEDGRVLRLIRRYLQAGMMSEGVVVARHEGTPQGGPLSPLLANLLPDEVDKELDKRGHAFARYADDCNVYVRSKRAGERVLSLLRRLYAGLRLRINEEKSAVAPAVTRQFLGFSLWVAPGKQVKHRVASKALKAMKAKVRQLTKRSGGRSMTQIAKDLRSYLLGWKGYFRLAGTPGVFRKLDEWIRHRLRAIQLKHWKRGKTIHRELVARGMKGVAAAGVAA
jgi:RNA-directed DNA polymerase